MAVDRGNRIPAKEVKLYNPDAVMYEWKGVNGKPYQIDLSRYTNYAELFENLANMRKFTMSAIHRAWHNLNCALLEIPFSHGSAFRRNPTPVNTPNLFNPNPYPETFANEKDFAKHVEQRMEQEWTNLQYAMQNSAFYVYGGSISPGFLSGCGPQERPVART